MSLFANLSESDQIKMLEETLTEIDKQVNVFLTRPLEGAWP